MRCQLSFETTITSTVELNTNIRWSGISRWHWDPACGCGMHPAFRQPAQWSWVTSCAIPKILEPRLARVGWQWYVRNLPWPTAQTSHGVACQWRSYFVWLLHSATGAYWVSWPGSDCTSPVQAQLTVLGFVIQTGTSTYAHVMACWDSCFCFVKLINTITHSYRYQLNWKHWQWQMATATVVISNETLIRIFYHMSQSLSVTKVRIAERSVEGRHSVIHHILKRAPRASVSYLSLELRFPSLQRVAATSPGCLQSIMNHLMGMERTDGLRKAVMWLVVILSSKQTILANSESELQISNYEECVMNGWLLD